MVQVAVAKLSCQLLYPLSYNSDCAADALGSPTLRNYCRNSARESRTFFLLKISDSTPKDNIKQETYNIRHYNCIRTILYDNIAVA